MTGGLGGIGFEIAKFLLQQYDAKLLLIGRTSLPEFSDKNCTDLAEEDSRFQRLKTLQALGGEVHYEVCDVGNFQQLQQSIQKAVIRMIIRMHLFRMILKA